MPQLTRDQAIAIADAQLALEAEQSVPQSGFQPGLASSGPIALGENALALGSGALARIPAGLAGLGAMLSQVPGINPAQVVEDVQSKLTFEPRTPMGKRLAQGISSTVAPIAEPVGEAITDFAETPLRPDLGFGPSLGEAQPVHPLISTALKTGIVGAPEVFGATQLAKAIPKTSPARPVAIPQVDDLFNAGRDAFTSARKLGSELKPAAPSRLGSRVANLKEKSGLKLIVDEAQHPKSFALRNRILQQTEGPMDFDDLLTLRQIAKDISGSLDRPEARLGLIMRNEIDDFISSLKADDLVSGAPQTATKMLQEGRELWRRARNAEKIEEQINLAGLDAGQFSGSGFENALTTKFRQLSRRIVKGQETSFNKAEAAAIMAIGQGGDSLTKTMRLIGKLAPTGVVSLGVGAGAGTLLGGPIGAVTVPAVGLLSRRLATNRVIGAANQADELARSGGLLGQ